MTRPRLSVLTLVTAAALHSCTAEAGPGPGAQEAAAAQPAPLEPPQPPPPPPTRIRLFDLMPDASFRDLPTSRNQSPAPQITRFDFDESQPDELFHARVEGNDLEWDEDLAVIDDAAGLEGGGLRLGPELAADRSRAVLLVTVPGLARVRVSGRVTIENNPKIDDATQREVMQVTEHSQDVTNPRRVRPWMRGRPKRVSRTLDPTGWDHFELSWITRGTTRTLEIALLHRSGDSAEAVTRYDDVVIEAVPLSEAEAYDHLEASYRPNDGNEESTPWRLRVDLTSADGQRGEVRDAVLLPPPATLALPVRMPEAETAPVLRFQYGMVREAHGAAGDGAHIDVSFRGDDGTVTELGSCETDPKNDKDHQRWQRARIDVSRVAGLTGDLEFTARDMGGEGPDPMDAVVLATPRIEPAEQAPPLVQRAADRRRHPARRQAQRLRLRAPDDATPRGARRRRRALSADPQPSALDAAVVLFDPHLALPLDARRRARRPRRVDADRSDHDLARRDPGARRLRDPGHRVERTDLAEVRPRPGLRRLPVGVGDGVGRPRHRRGRGVRR